MLATMISGVLLTSCTTMSVPEFRPRDASAYSLHTERDGLKIAIHPTTDPQTQDDIFRIDLVDRGILPILVVVENRSSSGNFVLAADHITVVRGEESGSAADRPSDVTSRAAATAAAAGALVLVSPLLVVVALKLGSDITVIEHNLVEKQFHSRTLAPGESAWGYVYAALPKESSPVAHYTVQVAAVEALSGATVVVTIPIEYRRP